MSDPYVGQYCDLRRSGTEAMRLNWNAVPHNRKGIRRGRKIRTP